MSVKSKKALCIPTILKVKVTQKHINNGKPRKAAFCPIALALKESGYKGVDVGDIINVKFGKFKPVYYNKRAEEFVSKFDDYQTVKPFEFEAELQLEEFF
jgi:hypothetical protein